MPPNGMELEYTKEHIKFEKVLSALDEFTLEFTAVLDAQKIKYVLIAGYVAILFGRSRSSEDIDLFIEPLTEDQFIQLSSALEHAGFMCIITDNPHEGYAEYLTQGLSLRFSRKDLFIPNMELKFTKNALDAWALHHRRTVIVNNTTIYISPLESQIAHKLDLGSDKDIEDAAYLYTLFSEYLAMDELEHFLKKLHVPASRKELLK